MTSRLITVLAGGAAALLSAAMVTPVRAEVINLLDNAADRLVASSLTPDELRQVRLLTDGDVGKSAPAIQGQLEFIVDLKAVHHTKQVKIHLERDANRKKPGSAQLEILGSVESADTGYQLIRSATISGNRQRSTLTFLPAAARWLMVRVKAGPTGQGIRLTEVQIPGYKGPPKSRYAFQDSPAEASAVLTRLRQSLKLELTAEEIALLDDAADGQLDNWTLAQAALLASGERQVSGDHELLKEIDALEASARRAVGNLSSFDRGERLLKHLHRTTFKGGYQEKQTDVSTVLKTGRYNCVSSAVLFGIIGQRLGMDVRGIEVPDHAFAIVYDGTSSADVETTNRAGFNPARNRQALQAFTDQTGFAYIPSSNASKRRETDMLGLVALIYYNHGVNLGRAKNYRGAVRAYYRALSLDPSLISAVKNTLASLGKWAEAESQAGDHQQARQLLNTALALAPKDYSLRHNRRVVWNRQISEAAQREDFDQVVALSEQAHREDPSAGFDRQQGRLFITRAHSLLKRGSFSDALSMLNDGYERVNEASKRTLDRHRASVVMRWMSTAIDAGQWDSAADAVRQGRRILPRDYRLQRNAAYLLQEWSESAFASQGDDAGYQAAKTVLDIYPDSSSVQRAARGFVLRRIKALKQQKDDASAVAAVARYNGLLRNKAESGKLVESIFVQRAADHIKQRQWAQAAEVYEHAAAQLDGGGKSSRYYQKNMAYIAQEWLRDSGADTDARARDLLTRFGDVRSMKRVVAAHYQRQVEAHLSSQRFDEATRVAERLNGLLQGANDGKRVVRYAYDKQARHWLAQKHWQQAVDVYDKALVALPNDSRLRRNAVATWHQWAKQHMDRKEWQAAITIYEKGQDSIPNERLFTRNIAYCKQQMAR